MRRRIAISLCLVFLLIGAVIVSRTEWGDPVSAQDTCSTGDVNADSKVDLSDAVYILGYLFSGGPPPAPCPPAVCKASRQIFIVRHAEKESGVTDPGLTPEGQARAERLKEVFTRTHVDAIYASELRRTYDTVVPLATDKGLPIVRYDNIREMFLLVDDLKNLPPGAVAVVASHSYAIDDLLGGLGIEDPPRVPTTEYDNLFVVTLPIEEATPLGLSRLRYQ